MDCGSRVSMLCFCWGMCYNPPLFEEVSAKLSRILPCSYGNVILGQFVRNGAMWCGLIQR